MSQPMFRSTALLFLSCLGVALAPALAQAQATTATTPGAGLGNIAGDPFTFYYAYYLPNQQVQSMRPTPMDTINQAVINRQYYAQTQNRSLYNPRSRLMPKTTIRFAPTLSSRGKNASPIRFASLRIPPTAMAQVQHFITTAPLSISPV